MKALQSTNHWAMYNGRAKESVILSTICLNRIDMAVMKSIYPDKILMSLSSERFFSAKQCCVEGVENWNCHMANPLFIC